MQWWVHILMLSQHVVCSTLRTGTTETTALHEIKLDIYCLYCICSSDSSALNIYNEQDRPRSSLSLSLSLSLSACVYVSLNCQVNSVHANNASPFAITAVNLLGETCDPKVLLYLRYIYSLLCRPRAERSSGSPSSWRRPSSRGGSSRWWTSRATTAAAMTVADRDPTRTTSFRCVGNLRYEQ